MFYTREQRNIIGSLLREPAEYHGILESLGSSFEAEILPQARRIDQEGAFPRENIGRLQGKGVFGMSLPEHYYGEGLPLPVYVATLEMLAKACANTALVVSVQGMVCEGIGLYGTEVQKRELLHGQGLVEGRSLAAFALTEPCCGSDAKSIETRAVRRGDRYVLNGSKTMITNAREADFVLVFAVTDRGISSFIVPGATPGFTVMKPMEKLGCRGNSLSAIRLLDCEVPADHLLGEEGRGLEYVKGILNAGRLTIAVIAVGIAQAAYEKSLSYSTRRDAFGASLSRFQLIQEKLANMVTEIGAARLLTYHAAHLKDQGRDATLEITQAKLFASEMALRVCDGAIQIHGGYGYLDAYDIHRHWRDARLLTIGEGTSEMMRLLIAHLAVKGAGEKV